MILETKVNCQNCREEKHDNCERPDSCKCAYYEHSNNLLIGVRVSKNMDIPKHEPLEYENALRDSERLKEIIENGRENNSEDFTIRELTKLLILSDHKISIIDIKKIIETWCDKFGIIRIDIGDIITSTLQDPEIFTNVKDIALNLGQRKKEIVFDKSQLIEASHWLMGRFNIKRIELTGDLIFFNDQYYEKNAEALIRRNVRTCLIKSKNNDVNEIVKYIEDSCIIVKSSDIENFTHLKCLLNGVYDELISKPYNTSKMTQC
ncbi:hypothetical protein AAA799B03_00388 [Marine Group I thaumarchaeote SCGC AAA799-B03]|uniref:Uncharacterized protein n=1 Tax=Marine Group I thaumarchaeote SCGC AAA799-B03 TaxID=1502289 RepID=A0A087S8J6_9ARCH|nr:hypothetical protein AAA799B03_00388 [Marine Group I thaumarchaeote SCGC AAA799-B03]